MSHQRHSYEHLSDEERLREIAKILVEGVALMMAEEAKDKRESLHAVSGKAIECTDNEQRVINCLIQFESLRPIEMQKRCVWSRSTTSRVIASLVEKDLVERIGRTSGTKVRLICPGKEDRIRRNEDI